MVRIADQAREIRLAVCSESASGAVRFGYTAGLVAADACLFRAKTLRDFEEDSVDFSPSLPLVELILWTVRDREVS